MPDDEPEPGGCGRSGGDRSADFRPAVRFSANVTVLAVEVGLRRVAANPTYILVHYGCIMSALWVHCGRRCIVGTPCIMGTRWGHGGVLRCVYMARPHDAHGVIRGAVEGAVCQRTRIPPGYRRSAADPTQLRSASYTPCAPTLAFLRLHRRHTGSRPYPLEAAAPPVIQSYAEALGPIGQN